MPERRKTWNSFRHEEAISSCLEQCHSSLKRLVVLPRLADAIEKANKIAEETARMTKEKENLDA